MSDDAYTDRQKRFELFRDYVKHEDHLINHRITWNLGIQTLLFGAFGYYWLKVPDPATSLCAQDKDFVIKLFGLVPGVGVLLSIFAVTGIFAAFLSFHTLAWRWEEEDTERGKTERKKPHLPSLGGGASRAALFLGLLASFGPTLAVTAIWVGIVAHLKFQAAFGWSGLIGLGAAGAILTVVAIFLGRARRAIRRTLS